MIKIQKARIEYIVAKVIKNNRDTTKNDSNSGCCYVLVSCSVLVSYRVLRVFDLSNHLEKYSQWLGFVEMEWKKMDNGMEWWPRERERESC
jgi:hypothetical protein